MSSAKSDRRIRIKRRIRKVVTGTADRPRMSVFRSNKEISAQLIDDTTGNTILAASSTEKPVATEKATKIEKSVLVGKLIAEKAAKAGITSVSFDRNGYLYHGRVKAIAEGAREGGLNF